MGSPANPRRQVLGRVQLAHRLPGERLERAFGGTSARLARRCGGLGCDRHCASNSTGGTNADGVDGASLGIPMRSELSRLVGAEHVLEAPPGSPYNHDAALPPGGRGTGRRGRAAGDPRGGRGGSWPGATSHDVPIVARGGGTGLVGGAVATHGGVVCSLERLRRVRELEPGLWRILPEAGVSTRNVQRLARENGLFFAPDPGAGEQSQIGGNVATNAGGPARAQVRRDGRLGHGPGGRARARRAGRGRRLDPQGRRRIRLEEPADRLGGNHSA